MFVQVVRGAIRDPESTFARLDLWLEELAPGAQGWLGTTAGVTCDHELVSFVRFSSAADARLNSDRIEQAQWWAESGATFAGDVSFDNYDDVTLFGSGGSDAAAVVEVTVGQLQKRRGEPDLASQLVERRTARGTEVIGGLCGLHDDGRFTSAVYLRHTPRFIAGSSGMADEAGAQVLTLEHLWFGSPGGAVRRRPAGNRLGFVRAGGTELRALEPAADPLLAAALVGVQRASYRIEADLIGDDRIPTLHEEVSDLQAAGLTWLGAYEQGALVGAVAWTEDEDELDLHRLMVCPSALRRGTGRRLVQAVLEGAGYRRVVVATGRANQPAQRLYEELGFVHRIDVEVLPGLWVSELVRPGRAAA